MCEVMCGRVSECAYPELWLCVRVCCGPCVGGGYVCSCVCPRLPQFHPTRRPGMLATGGPSPAELRLMASRAGWPVPPGGLSILARRLGGSSLVLRGARVTGRRPRRVSEPRHRQSHSAPGSLLQASGLRQLASPDRICCPAARSGLSGGAPRALAASPATDSGQRTLWPQAIAHSFSFDPERRKGP